MKIQAASPSPQAALRSGRVETKFIVPEPVKISQAVTYDYERRRPDFVPSASASAALKLFAQQQGIAQKQEARHKGTVLRQTPGAESTSTPEWNTDQLTAIGQRLLNARVQIQALSIQVNNSYRCFRAEKRRDQARLSSTANQINQALVARVWAKQGQQYALKKALQEIRSFEQTFHLEPLPDYSLTDKILLAIGGLANSLSFFVQEVVPAVFFNSLNLLLFLIKGSTVFHTEKVKRRTRIEQKIKEEILVPLIKFLDEFGMIPFVNQHTTRVIDQQTTTIVDRTESLLNESLNQQTTQVAQKFASATQELISPAAEQVSNALSRQSNEMRELGEASTQQTAAINTLGQFAAQQLEALQAENKQLREQIKELTEAQKKTNALLMQLLQQQKESINEAVNKTV